MAVAHVVHAEDEAVLVFGDGIANALKELVFLVTGPFGDLREVDDLGAPGLGHCVCVWLSVVEMKETNDLPLLVLG